MFTLAIIPLAASIILASGIIYFYFPRGVIDMGSITRLVKPQRPSAGERAVVRDGGDAVSSPDDILEREVSRVRKLAAELNKGRLDVEWTERQLEEKSKKLDMLITKAEQTLRKTTESESGSRTDKYSKAGMLLELGLPAEEIKSRLGLLSGELELIETLGRYRGGFSAAGRKKTPHPEHPSRSRRPEPVGSQGRVA